MQLLKRKNQTPLFQALQKIKEGQQNQQSIAMQPVTFLMVIELLLCADTCRIDASGIRLIATHSVPKRNF